MTDKEIIIDGVDVSECAYSFKQYDNWSRKNIISCACTLSSKCEPRKNHCKFYMKQQLKRAEQKLEKIKEYLNSCNLKADFTACDILQIIEGGENE